MKSGVISPEQESSKANEIYEIQKELDKKLNRIRETHSHILFQKRETLNVNFFYNFRKIKKKLRLSKRSSQCQ